ncbi:putative DnaJ domain, Chaperone J-domain superfamily [Helianthus annuus]|nr:putative DnaJ domain, Chaperone J-domain superfamily [Helianthus annuus]
MTTTAAAATTTDATDEFVEESISKSESLRLKTLAEQTYSSSDLKSALKYAKRAHRLCPTLHGLSDLLTAFKILTTAADNTTGATTTPHWYKILDLEPFSHINSIKKQYKKLALILHPDKNSTSTCVALEDAFKLVNDAFSVLSDKIRRKEYDMRLRIDMQCEAVAATAVGNYGGVVAMETFWTACTCCRLLHEFERRYLGHSLMCPNCKKSFEAVEADGGEKVVTDAVDDDDDDEILSRSDLKRKMSSVGDIMKRSERVRKSERLRKEDGDKRLRVGNNAVGKGSKVRDNGKLKENGKIMDDDDEEMMTLAEMQKLVNDDDDDDNDNDNDGDDDDNEEDEDEKMTLAEMQKHLNDDDDEEEEMTLAEMQKLVKINVNKLKVNEKDKAQRSGSMSSHSKNKTNEERNNQDPDIMTVEDSDFYDFDEGRVEKSFKKGQIWALYDDDDQMPRHYGLIDEVVSTHPFEVNMSWLDPQINGDDMLTSLESTRFHISCGRFKVSNKTSVASLNVFSHIVNCERAAREIYRIYPKKGSVWALYNEHGERESHLARDKRRYDIVVFLTSYSEVHVLSMAHLEKVKGFKTTFRRQEIGCHAIKWLEKHEARLFSHQIPARKLSGDEVPNLSGDYWELDPASLPTHLITTNGKK